MNFLRFLIFIIINRILSEDAEVYQSPCEESDSPSKFEDCLGKSCEFVEEKCCYLEYLNETSEVKRECIDFYFYDYMRDDLKQQAINKIKKGEYWDNYNDTYDEIISLRCNCENLFPNILLLLPALILF